MTMRNDQTVVPNDEMDEFSADLTVEEDQALLDMWDGKTAIGYQFRVSEAPSLAADPRWHKTYEGERPGLRAMLGLPPVPSEDDPEIPITLMYLWNGNADDFIDLVNVYKDALVKW